MRLPAEARGYLKRVKDSGEHMGQPGRRPARLFTVRPPGPAHPAGQHQGHRRSSGCPACPSIEGRQVDVVIGELPDAECDAALLETGLRQPSE